MQFPVPQNIDLEDKLVGPLTLVQFLYVLGGGISDYLLYIFIGGGFWFWVLALPIAAVALALAFLKIQEQPLSHFLKAGLYYYSRPKVRLWLRKGVNIHLVRENKNKVKTVIGPPPKRHVEKSELEKLAYSLDTHGSAVGGNPK